MMKLFKNYIRHCALFTFAITALIASPETTIAKIERLLYLHMVDAQFIKTAETIFQGEVSRGKLPSSVAKDVMKEFSATDYIHKLALNLESSLTDAELNDLLAFFENSKSKSMLHELMSTTQNAGEYAMKQKMIELKQDDPTVLQEITNYLGSDTVIKFGNLVVSSNEKLERECFIKAAVAAQEIAREKYYKSRGN